MLNITNRAKNVSPSLTLAITAKANKLKESGVDIVSFAAGEPDFNTPEFIVNAAKDALDKGLTKYTPASGIAPLKKAVCAKLKRDNALDYQPEQIVISTGAKQSLFQRLADRVSGGGRGHNHKPLLADLSRADKNLRRKTRRCGDKSGGGLCLERRTD